MGIQEFMRFSVSRVEQRQTSDVAFACPSCRSDQAHDVILVRAPSGLLGRFLPLGSAPIEKVLVECHRCRVRFASEAMDRPLFSDRTST